MSIEILTDEQLDKMRHAVGMSDYPRRKWGFRNRYAVGSGDVDALNDWDVLVNKGLASGGNRGGSVVMYHLTIAGCEAIGMHKSAIKRAMEE